MLRENQWRHFKILADCSGHSGMCGKWHDLLLLPQIITSLKKQVGFHFRGFDLIFWGKSGTKRNMEILILVSINPFTAGVLGGVLKGDCNFCVCGWNPTMWPFKWKLPACTFTWYFLFFKILENEIWKSGRNLPLTTFGSGRVNHFP